MEWVLFLALGGGIAVAVRRVWDRRAARRADAADVLEMRKVAEEDITLLGEELSRLGQDVAGNELDAATRRDYQVALDAYESAQLNVRNLRTADAISTITDTLATGRYAMTCVRARVAGVAVPERRVPCFLQSSAWAVDRRCRVDLAQAWDPHRAGGHDGGGHGGHDGGGHGGFDGGGHGGTSVRPGSGGFHLAVE